MKNEETTDKLSEQIREIMNGIEDQSNKLSILKDNSFKAIQQWKKKSEYNHNKTLNRTQNEKEKNHHTTKAEQNPKKKRLIRTLFKDQKNRKYTILKKNEIKKKISSIDAENQMSTYQETTDDERKLKQKQKRIWRQLNHFGQHKLVSQIKLLRNITRNVTMLSSHLQEKFWCRSQSIKGLI